MTLEKLKTAERVIGIKQVTKAINKDQVSWVFLGTNAEAEKIECGDKINLKGRLMLPGFVDSHMHMLNYAFVENSVKLFDCRSVEDALEKAKKRLERLYVYYCLLYFFCVPPILWILRIILSYISDFRRYSL